MGDLHFRGDAGQHGRLIIGTAEFVSFTAGHQLSTLCKGIFNVFFDFLQARHFNQRPLMGLPFQTGADFHGISSGGEFFRKFIINTVLHVDAIRAHTCLPGVAEFRRHGT